MADLRKSRQDSNLEGMYDNSQLTYRHLYQQTDEVPIDKKTIRQTNQPTDRPTNRQTNQQTDVLVDRRTNREIDPQTDRPMDRQTDK